MLTCMDLPTGYRIRLADTELLIEVERDLTIAGEKAKFGGKVLRDGMEQSASAAAETGGLDLVINNPVILDHWGIIKADIGISCGRIVGIGKPGNPDIIGASDLTSATPVYEASHAASCSGATPSNGAKF